MNEYFMFKSAKFLMMINGISVEDINDMSMKEVDLFLTYEAFYRENNNKEIGYWIAKSIVGGK